MPTMLPQGMLLKFMGLSGRNIAITYPPPTITRMSVRPGKAASWQEPVKMDMLRLEWMELRHRLREPLQDIREKASGPVLS